MTDEEYNSVLEEAAKVADQFAAFAKDHPKSISVHLLTAEDIAWTLRDMKKNANP